MPSNSELGFPHRRCNTIPDSLGTRHRHLVRLLPVNQDQRVIAVKAALKGFVVDECADCGTAGIPYQGFNSTRATWEGTGLLTLRRTVDYKLKCWECFTGVEQLQVKDIR